MKLYILSIDLKSNGLEDHFNELLTFLDEDNRCKILKVKNKEAQTRSLAGQLLIRSIIHNDLNIPNTDIRFSKNEYGKPYLENNPDFHFNITHSNNQIVCITDGDRVGVDVQHIKPIGLDLARKFFTEQEHLLLTNIVSYHERLETFYDIWTLKESFIKAVGKGFHIPLNTFNLVHEDKLVSSIYFEESSYYFRRYDTIENYKLSVCSVNPDFDSHINHVEPEELVLIYKQ
ncbi:MULTISPECIES: 4'-phosphopantetheinyl transferase family protein [Paenibacillus]|uniref:4'-phosphopantetheinyl transferase family protein n=1 Tax=Paenibacillus TaxID=44249 RepID=UPI0011A5EAAC|nr:4'-phosphopantetheinyl transferase superfamily protein [Paenibacillus sp. Y412MC10]